MNDFEVIGTDISPSVKFSFITGHLLIEGKSILENSLSFYEPIIDLIDSYKENPADSTTIDFRLEYFNTSSSKCILDILKKLQTLQDEEKEVCVNWYYDKDDEEILEIGEDYSKIINLPFHLKVIESN